MFTPATAPKWGACVTGASYGLTDAVGERLVMNWGACTELNGSSPDCAKLFQQANTCMMHRCNDCSVVGKSTDACAKAAEADSTACKPWFDALKARGAGDLQLMSTCTDDTKLLTSVCGAH